MEHEFRSLLLSKRVGIYLLRELKDARFVVGRYLIYIVWALGTYQAFDVELIWIGTNCNETSRYPFIG